MKRILIILIFVFLLGISFAEETEDPQILFRGIPWGSSYKEVSSAVSDSFTLDSPEQVKGWETVDDYLFDPLVSAKDHDIYKITLGIRCFEKDLKGLHVGGYPVRRVACYFVYTVGPDGFLVKDLNHTALIRANYVFSPDGPDEAYNILVAKLSLLYGDVDFQENSSGKTTIHEQSLWYGADGTMVSLTKTKQMYSSDVFLRLSYSYTGGDELLAEAYSAVVYEETQNAGNDMDGL